MAQCSIKHIIIDCSCVNYIDTQGVNSILQLYDAFKEIGVGFYLSYCKRNHLISLHATNISHYCYSNQIFLFAATVIKSFRKVSLQEKFDFDFIFATTHDAVMFLTSKNMSVSSVENEAHNRIQLEDDQTDPDRAEFEYATYPHLTYKNREDTYDSGKLNDFF